ncbi:MAG: hypothetical protein KDC83_15480 [Flavobacteriales bacterium]|nr:hypothetical protein [Flavobacteriales bacterium]
MHIKKRKYNHIKRLLVLASVFSVALFFSAFSSVFASNSQAASIPFAPNVTACADFTQVGAGNSVEGLGTVHPNLNISTSGNAVAVVENQDPRAYGAPNGDGSIPNGGVDILGSGFSDIEQSHDYTFTFSPDVTIDFFSIQMLDYGDFNPVHATEHTVTLAAYDATDSLVDSHVLSFTSDGQSLPVSGSAGDLWLTGDAVSAVPGEPGNFTFVVTGNEIVRVALEFTSELGPGATDPNFALAILCFSTEDEPPTPPAGTVCADFAQIPVGASVEGLGTIHPDLNINTTGNAVVVAETQDPKAYGAPNGDNSILNGGVDALLNGFFDETKTHEYDFSFGPDLTVDYFSVQMLDYGDFNPVHASEQSISLAAYDANGALVDINTLAYTSDPASLPRSGSAGDLWLTGDAITANPGQPGNYTFFVSGQGIARLELQFASDLGPGATDPNFALSVLCFETEQVEPKLDPPTAVLNLIRPKTSPEIGGKFLVEYACSETAPNLVSATINGYDVIDGQQVNLVIREEESPRIIDDVLVWLFAPEFSFDITCADDNGNQVSTTVIPEFDIP